MFSATIRVTFDAAHRVLGHLGKCRYLHGHSYVAELTFTRLNPETLDELGFVEDFSILKNAVKDWINFHWDHNMILNQDDPIFKILGKIPSPIEYCLNDITGGREPYCMDKGINPTAENMAKVLYHVVDKDVLPKVRDIRITKVRIQETENSWAEYEEKL